MNGNLGTVRRKLLLDVCDYTGTKLCSLYDSFSDITGQAYNVVVTTQRNGSKLLSFSIPTMCHTNKGEELNFRLSFLKADYKILFEDEKLKDWYYISEPKISHNGITKTVSVVASHCSQLLKYKNLLLLFSDDEGNNTGTAYELVSTILEGTGWECGTIANFYEDDSYDYNGPDNTNNLKKIKYRSITASAKTGAFKLISTVCDKFNAKPVYRGWTKTVDIYPMNPFELPEDGGVPDVDFTDGVIELHYGNNVKTIDRTINTENLATRLYVYGSWGDTDLGYLSIATCNHTLYVFFTGDALQAGNVYFFTVDDDDGISITYHFTCPHDIEAGKKLVYSLLDPASMMYLWEEEYENKDADGNVIDPGYAIVVTKGKQGVLFPTMGNDDILKKLNNTDTESTSDM